MTEADASIRQSHAELRESQERLARHEAERISA